MILAAIVDAFARPAAWPLLLLAPMVAFASIRAARSAALRRARALGPRAHEAHAKLHALLPAAAIACAALAAMEPVLGAGARAIGRADADVVVLLDVSRSMLARDTEPDRREAARAAILALADRVRESPGDRLGLVVFAGEARLVTPLTRDVASFAELVRSVGVESITRGGTDVGAAIDAGLAAVAADFKSAAIVLVTDGEDLAASGRAAADRARARGIAVHCVGIGSASGSKVVLEAPAAGAAEFLRDRTGREVVTTLDESGLRAIAAATGGEYRRLDGGASPLVDLQESAIVPAAQRTRASEDRGPQDERTRRFQWPLAVAILLWMLDVHLRTRRHA